MNGFETAAAGPAVRLGPDRLRTLADHIEQGRDPRGRASGERLAMTYSARPYAPLHEAVAAAVDRGVTVRIVVETLQGARGALSGAEPAAAFRGTGAQLWHWPATGRTGRMHAKIAVADRRELLLSGADLAQPGVRDNIEAGLLVTGGSAPERVAEHFDALRAAGTLQRM